MMYTAYGIVEADTGKMPINPCILADSKGNIVNRGPDPYTLGWGVSLEFSKRGIEEKIKMLDDPDEGLRVIDGKAYKTVNFEIYEKNICLEGFSQRIESVKMNEYYSN